MKTAADPIPIKLKEGQEISWILNYNILYINKFYK